MLNFINQLFYLKLFLKCLNGFLLPLSFVFLDLIFFTTFLLKEFFLTFLSFLPLKVIVLILLSLAKALALIVLTAFPITTVLSFEHFLNAFFPIDLTFLPIVTLLSFLHPENVLLLILVTLLPIVTFLSPLHPANALPPIVVTFLKLILFNLVHLLNADAPIVLIPAQMKLS